MSSEIERQAAKLIQNFNSIRLQPHREKAAHIKKYYSPRAQFNRWRDSDEGQAWKQRQYEQLMDSQCPECGHKLPSIEYFQIDHIKPISTHPECALELENLQLLCSPCNLKKSTK